MDVEELYSRYEKGERDFSGVDLSGAVLTITYVSDYDPTQNILSGINLSFANLEKASLAYVNLIGANLSGANLTKSELGCASKV